MRRVLGPKESSLEKESWHLGDFEFQEGKILLELAEERDNKSHVGAGIKGQDKVVKWNGCMVFKASQTLIESKQAISACTLVMEEGSEQCSCTIGAS